MVRDRLGLTDKHPHLPPGVSPHDIDQHVEGEQPEAHIDECRECGEMVDVAELYRHDGECDECAGPDLRWIAWVRESTVARTEDWVSEHQMFTTAMDIILGDVPQYATKFHLSPEGVGGSLPEAEWGNNDNSGTALCGAKVPRDGEETVRLWATPDEQPHIDKCKRCKNIADSDG